ncbi:MAG: quinone oxidoreductase [Acidobacteriota bacterium]|nr:quinone oxidoreductase [Acidobacteriota bacterium]MDH3785638.1 quinone oxidoreductase [Acidobacteriota bacterium]
MQTHAIRIHETGGPEVLRWESVELSEPANGEIRVRQAAIGLNFIDTYHRSGLYPLPTLPAVLGREGAGIIEAVGVGVAAFQVGDRVAYPMHPGAYAEHVTLPADRVVPLPDEVTCEQAAAMMLKGLTAHYLLRRTFRVEAGQTILFHAAAGGVGLIACQWAHALGVEVIGTVGSEEKAELARNHGCRHIIRYDREDFAERVSEITSGVGVPVVYDSVGVDTFERSLDCLAPLGTLVSFGQSSGAIPPVDLGILAAKGSLFVTRPTLATFIADTISLRRAAAELFEVVAIGDVKVEIRQRYALREAETAHRDLEARRTRGSTILTP